MQQIKVSASIVKKTGGSPEKPWTIREITTEDGKKYDTFDNLEVGQEYSVNVKENPPYNPSASLIKEKKFGMGKNYDFEKKRVALECATQLFCSDKINGEQFEPMRDKFFNYLNT